MDGEAGSNPSEPIGRAGRATSTEGGIDDRPQQARNPPDIVTRVRLAVAAAVLVGGGAAGVAAVAASHGTDNVASTGFTSSAMSWQQGMSWAMDNWNTKPQQSLVVITKTVTVQTITMGTFHTHTFVTQRGTVVAKAPWEFVVKSTTGNFGVWHFNGGTKFVNIGNSKTGWNAMSGGTMSSMGSWNWSDMANSSWNSHTKTIAKGDLVFVFGTKCARRLEGAAGAVRRAVQVEVLGPVHELELEHQHGRDGHPDRDRHPDGHLDRDGHAGRDGHCAEHDGQWHPGGLQHPQLAR